jgi:ankyrin repeat protein
MEETSLMQVAVLLAGQLADIAALGATSTAVAATLVDAHSRPCSTPSACCAVIAYGCQSEQLRVEDIGSGKRAPLASTAAAGRIGPLCWLLSQSCFPNASQALRQLCAPNEADASGATPLHYAALEGRTHVCRMLIQNNGNVNAADHCGITPLHLAAEAGHNSTVDVLIDAKGNVAALDKERSSPLLLAAEGQHVAVCKMLTSAGADPLQTNSFGKSALGVAQHAGHKVLIGTLTAAQKPVRLAAQTQVPSGLHAFSMACKTPHASALDAHVRRLMLLNKKLGGPVETNLISAY